ncbi:MAG: PDZ domain-containing protein [Oligoflexia bacterium]|nr:PDZ domain-containing protein [Oligoflexia bacterium]
MALGRFFKSKEAFAEGVEGTLTSIRATWSRLPIKDFPLQKYAPHLTAGIVALMGADLTSVYVRQSMLPSSAPPMAPVPIIQSQYKPKSDYDSVLDRNIFNSDGIIPEVQIAEGAPEGTTDFGGPARESSLPLNLVGTIVHANPGKSVATIQANNSADKILPYIPNDAIEGLATLLKVERKKAFIRNLQTGTLEYIQIKDEPAFMFKTKAPTKTSGDGPIVKESEDTFAISRSELESQMNNLPELLTQARAVPNLVPGSPGKTNGFRIVDIQEGSIFRKFGIEPGDVISGVNGEALDSPAKAMEFYNQLRSSSELKLQIERNGKPMTMNYKIN